VAVPTLPSRRSAGNHRIWPSDNVRQVKCWFSHFFTAIEPSLQQFYAALDDKQKAHLLRDLTLAPPLRASDRTAERSRDRSERRRGRYRAYAEATNREYEPDSSRISEADSNRTKRYGPPHPCGEGSGVPRSNLRCRPTNSTSSVNRWAAICEDLTTTLRNRPISDIERGVRLSEPQRVAFYGLVTASLKAADTLGSVCPAEHACVRTRAAQEPERRGLLRGSACA
jgi:hypothetical protein